MVVFLLACAGSPAPEDVSVVLSPEVPENPPPLEGRNRGPAPSPEGLPSFADLIGPDGESVQIRVKVPGALAGQVDFQVVRHGRPHLLHTAPILDEEVSVRAPAQLDEELYVMAVSWDPALAPKGEEELRSYVYSDNEPPLDRAFGGLDEPLVMDGQDLSVEITLGSTPRGTTI